MRALFIGFVMVCVTAAPVEGVVTIVILPPQIEGGAKKSRSEVETLGDLLAAQLSDDKSIKVVDRSQLKRVLAERAMANKPGAQLLSYDVMVRLSANLLRSRPQITIKTIDLEMGNVMKSATYPWSKRFGRAQLRQMVGLCKSSAQLVGKMTKGKKKVRFVGTLGQVLMPRTQPLVDRINRSLIDALKASPGIVLVQHLEATTSAEESLLLYSGLSRLPGGRQFAPQADLVIELRLKERNALGKTFKQTPVEVAFRTDASKNWSTVLGTYGQADKILKDLWVAIAAKISSVDVKAGMKIVDTSALRRRQAEAELNRYPNSSNVREYATFSRAKTKEFQAMLGAMSAAVKLDPTWEEAAYRRLRFASADTSYRNSITKDRRLHAKNIKTMVDMALQYIERFDGGREHRSEAYFIARTWIGSQWRIASPAEKSEIAHLTRKLTDRILDETYKRHYVCIMEHYISEAYKRLVKSGTPIAGAREWRDKAFRRAHAVLKQARESGNIIAPWRYA
ncbi:MAG: hypothetical protein GY794_14090, partial [bacterium]|nr:hypothetical protein [bacterium]